MHKSMSTELFEYVNNYCCINSSNTFIVHTGDSMNIKNSENSFDSIINLFKVNDIRYVNKFFEAINGELSNNDMFICCVETIELRNKKKQLLKGSIFNIGYELGEFIFLRIFPKVKFLKKIYFAITQGKNRLISKSETLGRLVSCGFYIVDFKEFDGLLYVVSKKVDNPSFDMHPSYGALFSMARVGKEYKIIKVFKLRTMHPYSEYLQDYMFEKNGSLNGDKVINDFRISIFGKILRKFWIDEIPMLLNLIKGDLKIVGVRPLSVSKFNMYPKYAQEARVKFKPGLIPPFYVDLPKDFNGLVASEMKYLKEHEKRPIFTDLKYFFIAMSNILVKGARSS